LPLAAFVFEVQHGQAAVVHATMAAEVDDVRRDAFAGAQALLQTCERAAFLDGQQQLMQAPGSLEDAGFLGFEVEHRFTLRRGRHEQQAEIAVHGLLRVFRGAEAACQLERPQRVARQVAGLGTRRGQQLPRGVVQQASQVVLDIGRLQDQPARAGTAQPAAQPAGIVEPARHFAADLEQLAIRVVQAGQPIMAFGPGTQPSRGLVAASGPIGARVGRAFQAGTQAVSAGGDESLSGCRRHGGGFPLGLIDVCCCSLSETRGAAATDARAGPIRAA